MAIPKLSILTFPQRIEAGKLYFNILLLPRNINPLTDLDLNFAAFADAVPSFKAVIVDNVDSLPVDGTFNFNPDAQLIEPAVSSREVWETLKTRIQQTDGLKIADVAETEDRAEKARQKYKDISIKKYLPESYRAAFNYTQPRTKNAVTGDEYHCSIKNSGPSTDTKTNRDTISWGKAIALCLRSPLLAKKAGLIYEAVVDLPLNAFQTGGWLYADFGDQSSYKDLRLTLGSDIIKQYAALIPPLKKTPERMLFAALQFPVGDGVNNGEYDEILREAMMYNDGFAKIVHANQPINDYLLEEKDKSTPPQKDVGIRLGWDDEQLTIWQNRQMKQKEEITDQEIDVPTGVFSYCIDAKFEGEPNWHSQNKIITRNPITISSEGGLVLAPKDTVLEVGSEVHPAAHGNSEAEGFWLPMYFTNWMGKSLAIPDSDAEEIHQTKASAIKETKSRFTDPNYYKSLTPALTDAEIDARIADYNKNNAVNVVPKKTFHAYITNPEDQLDLLYGETYNFRIRLMDLTGGTPDKSKNPINGGERPIESWHFKRHTAAGAVKIVSEKKAFDNQPLPDKPKDYDGQPLPPDMKNLEDTSILENILDPVDSSIIIRRPGLAYPAVVFTGKYKNPDAVTRLKAILQNPPAGQSQGVDIALPDPDVNSFRVLVEIKSLEMDNALSIKGNEAFVPLYEKVFNFSDDTDADFKLTIVYAPFPELPFDKSFSKTGGDSELIIPLSRNVRLTFTSIVSKADDDYADASIKFGGSAVLSSFKLAAEETDLFNFPTPNIKAIYLQPEDDGHKKTAVNKEADYPEKQIRKSSTPPEIDRLADELNISAHNLTLEGPRGKRVQFGCTHQMRHSLAPDSSSITFSSLAEVFNHWIIAPAFTLKRDWSWNGLEVISFIIKRQVGFSEMDLAVSAIEVAGTVKVSHTVNINALGDAEREYSEIIFLDTLDPKDYNTGFPKELFVQYTIKPILKGLKVDEIKLQVLQLPITTIPAQIPKLVSAGIALSKYAYDEEKYTSSDTRQRFLWLEMAEPPLDPQDTFYVRVLANSPDPMLCEMNSALLFNVPEEPPLIINPEKIRIIFSNVPRINSSMGAMQEMVPNQPNDPRFYMVPLPAGLHSESDELFGFFTYEIRLGHKNTSWCTAQGRFGRPLKVNGVQHPAPALICTATRRKVVAGPGLLRDEIAVNAPFANAVLDGKNTAAQPPQTSLWAFLYAQVKQADGKAYRNILLGSKPMPYRMSQTQKDTGNRYGLCSFDQTEISDLLDTIGLPVTVGLSVLCAEMFPASNMWRIDDDLKPTDPFFQHGLNAAGAPIVEQKFNPGTAPQAANMQGTMVIGEESLAAMMSYQISNPLINELGKYRIYRTSALAAAENICCDCD